MHHTTSICGQANSLQCISNGKSCSEMPRLHTHAEHAVSRLLQRELEWANAGRELSARLILQSRGGVANSLHRVREVHQRSMRRPEVRYVPWRSPNIVDLLQGWHWLRRQMGSPEHPLASSSFEHERIRFRRLCRLHFALGVCLNQPLLASRAMPTMIIVAASDPTLGSYSAVKRFIAQVAVGSLISAVVMLYYRILIHSEDIRDGSVKTANTAENSDHRGATNLPGLILCRSVLRVVLSS